MRAKKLVAIALPALLAVVGGAVLITEVTSPVSTTATEASWRTPTAAEAKTFHHVPEIAREARVVPGTQGTEWEMRNPDGKVVRVHGHAPEGQKVRIRDRITDDKIVVPYTRKLTGSIPDDADPPDWEVSNWTGGDGELAGPTGRYECASSGPRVQIVYMYPDIWDRRDQFEPEAEKLAKVFSATASHASTVHGGPPIAKVRVACSGGKPDIINVVIRRVPGEERCGFLWLDTCEVPIEDWEEDELELSTGEVADNLKEAGVWEDNRAYLVIWDGFTPEGAAWGQLDDDDSTSPDLSDSKVSVTPTSFTRTRSVMHELFHTMGAIQDSAPHVYNGAHCSDGQDLLCYGESIADGGEYDDTKCEGSPMIVDCGGDDYFNPLPKPGSYIAGHRNVAKLPYWSFEGTNRCEWRRRPKTDDDYFAKCDVGAISPPSGVIDEDRDETVRPEGPKREPRLENVPIG